MGEIDQRQLLEVQIRETLSSIYDPEIPVNIYELGLVYEIRISDDNYITIVMTLTSPNCPVAESLPIEVRERLLVLDHVKGVDIELVFDPPWEMSMMSEAAKLELGFL